MPIYEYVCDDCGYEKEILQRISDEPLSHCPGCHRGSFRKRISAAGFRLKGTGWYETDFKTGSRKNLAESGTRESAEKPAQAASAEGA